MPTSLALLDKALEIQHAAAWARDLNLDHSAIAQAKRRGRLSPTLAGVLAQRLNEDPKHWIAIAALEAEPETPLKESILKKIAKL